MTIYKSLIVLSVTTGSISIASSFLLGLIFFYPGDTYTRRMFFLLHLGLEGVTEVDTDPRDRFVSFKVTTSNESSVYAPSGYSTIEQLDRWYFFEGLEKYMQNKNEGNENKIMLGDLNCTMEKIDRDGENKTQRLYRCCSNYTWSKLIVDNGIQDLWRRENPDSPEFIC